MRFPHAECTCTSHQPLTCPPFLCLQPKQVPFADPKPAAFRAQA